MAQRYRDPVAQERMAAGTCPECAEPPERHSDSPLFWERGWFHECSLLPRGVQERIVQYHEDMEGL